MREARLNRGVDLYEVQRVTKIRVQTLRAMEEDRWEAIPESDAEEQLSAYGRFLGLDEAELLEQFRHPGELEDRAEPVSRGVIKPGGRLPRPPSPSRSLILGGLLAAVVVLGIVVIASLRSSNNGGEDGTVGKHARPGSASNSNTTTTTASAVSVELRSTADVWVCLVDQRQRALVDGETLTTDETRGPFDGKAFDATFGNGSVELTVNGQPVRVPPISAPLGYRITPDGATRLAPSDEPTCT